MAIYRCEAKIISRGSGHSAVAAAAYRTGTKIKDERMGRIQDYSCRTKGVLQSVILRPENSPEWTAHTASLWNAVELGEKRKDAQLCREFVLACPKELSAKEQMECAVQWAQSELVSKGMIAEVSLHHPKGSKNEHVHILCTMRTIEGDKFSAKKPREWNAKTLLLHWRESWCKAENDALEKAGRPERVDHRSLKDQGIDRTPEPKIGKEAAGLKKRGVEADPVNYQKVRAVRLWNATRPIATAIRMLQPAIGRTLWEKSRCLALRVQSRAGRTIKGAWQKLLDSTRSKTTTIEPDRDR